MKCELCHDQPAETVLYRRAPEKPGGVEELYVCHGCADRERAFGQERGIQVTAMEAPAIAPLKPGDPSPFRPEDFAKQMHDLMEQMQAHFKTSPEGEEEGARCPGCGMTLEEVRSVGQMGCPTCYTFFRKHLKALLDLCQDVNRYAGDPLPGLERKQRRAALVKRFDEAVAREDYAEAKRLKEELRRLDEAGGAPDA